MARGLTLEEFTAINDELAALTRLGVPLESGLAGLSRDLPGQLGRAAGAISQRLAAGEPLEQILESPSFGFPPAYRSVIVAGIRSGKLTRALEEVAATARRTASLRRVFLLSLIYPLIVLAVAYAGLLVSLAWTTPKILDALTEFQGELPGIWAWLRPLGDSMAWWAPWPPLAVLAGLMWQWRRWSGRGSLRRSALAPAGTAASKRRQGRDVDPARLATFLDLLGLMIGNQVPLPEALVLAADTAGVGAWQTGARTAAARLNSGERLSRDLLFESGLPAGAGWLAAGGSSPQGWAESLRNAAEGQRRRADRRQARFEQRWPILLSLGLGMGLVMPYMAVLILPWLDFIRVLLQ